MDCAVLFDVHCRNYIPFPEMIKVGIFESKIYGCPTVNFSFEDDNPAKLFSTGVVEYFDGNQEYTYVPDGAGSIGVKLLSEKTKMKSPRVVLNKVQNGYTHGRYEFESIEAFENFIGCKGIGIIFINS